MDNKIIATIVWFIAGSVLWFFMMSNFYQWWDMGGVVAGFILAPGVIVFPLIYWFKVGVFPMMYFIIWCIGIGGLLFSSSEGSK